MVTTGLYSSREHLRRLLVLLALVAATLPLTGVAEAASGSSTCVTNYSAYPITARLHNGALDGIARNERVCNVDKVYSDYSYRFDDGVYNTYLSGGGWFNINLNRSYRCNTTNGYLWYYPYGWVSFTCIRGS